MHLSVRFRFTAIAVVGLIVSMMSACTSLFDRQAPTPGGGLTVVSVGTGSAVLSWTAASDNSTKQANLQYLVYGAADSTSVDTLDHIQTGSLLTTVTGTTTATVSGLASGSHYFNVVVKDSAGNEAAYTQTSFVFSQFGTAASATTYDMSAGGTLQIDQILPSGPHIVYAVLTNGGSDAQSPPTVSLSTSSNSVARSAAQTTTSVGRTAEYSGSNPRLTVPAKVAAFNRHPAALSTGTERALSATAQTAPSSSGKRVGDTLTFNYLDVSNSNQTTTATLESQVTGSKRKLNIWVADSSNLGSDTIPSGEIANVAREFIGPSSANQNNIYDIETNIYGEPWGTTSDSSLIGDDETINILFANMGHSGGSFVVGYFYAADNYTQSSLAETGYHTNQMLMFYINTYAYHDSTSIDGEQLVYSTLAHEFQHMIHFYRKTVLLADGTGTDTWINEMMSMSTEDLLSHNLGTSASGNPRGVDGNTATAGSLGNTDGRMPAFDAYDDISLTNWGAVDTIASYGVAYSFGAYLMRNYGGAELLHDMMYNQYTDYQAVTQAVSDATGTAVDFPTLLRRWAVAALISDETSATDGYRYNSGTWFGSGAYDYAGPSTTYSLGSINAWNYTWADSSGNIYTGPYLYGPGTINGWGQTQPGYSNEYVLLGTSVSGSLSATFTTGPNNYVTIVVK